MAVFEHSFGCFYLATVETSTAAFPPHVTGIVELTKPWHKGKAVMLPWWSRRWITPRGIVIGLWFRKYWHNKSPYKLLDVTVSEIAGWDNGAEMEETYTTDAAERAEDTEADQKARQL